MDRAGGSRWVWAPGRCWAGWALRALAALRLCPREAQRTEGRGPQQAQIRHLRGHVALSSELDGGEGRLPSRAGLERPWVGEHRDLVAAHRTPPPLHAWPAALVPKALLAPGRARQVLAWGGCVRGRGGVRQPESSRGSCSSSEARALWRAVVGWPGRQARAKGRRAQGCWGAWRQPPPSTAIPPRKHPISSDRGS